MPQERIYQFSIQLPPGYSAASVFTPGLFPALTQYLRGNPALAPPITDTSERKIEVTLFCIANPTAKYVRACFYLGFFFKPEAAGLFAASHFPYGQ